MKQLVSIPLQQVTLSESRPTVPETVNALASSMRELGLMQPITLRAVGQGYRVVAGNHRVSAARALGWSEIEAFVVADHGQADQELREIDENLIRAALTPAQRAWAIKRRKDLWERLYGAEQEPGEQEQPSNSGQSLATNPESRGRGRPREFAAETAERTGQSKSAINHQVARGTDLGDTLHEITGTSLDKGVELDALRRLPKDDRRELIDRARAGEQVSARRQKHRRYLAGGPAEGQAETTIVSRAEHLCPNCKKAAWKVRSSEQVTPLYRIRYRYCPECGCRGRTGEETLEIHHTGAEPNQELLPLLSAEARAELKRLTETT